MYNEQVLVVKTELLQEILKPRIVELSTSNNNKYKQTIINNYEFIPREVAEMDIGYKQIIPYAMIIHKNKFLLIKRFKTQSESRLHNKLSLGIGGHINPSDESSAHNIITEGLNREVNEEIQIDPNHRVTLVGAINDDISDVGKHHLGMFYTIQVTNSNFSVLETDKMEALWVTKDDLLKSYSNMESWSQIIFDNYL